MGERCNTERRDGEVLKKMLQHRKRSGRSTRGLFFVVYAGFFSSTGCRSASRRLERRREKGKRRYEEGEWSGKRDLVASAREGRRGKSSRRRQEQRRGKTRRKSRKGDREVEEGRNTRTQRTVEWAGGRWAGQCKELGRGYGRHVCGARRGVKKLV